MDSRTQISQEFGNMLITKRLKLTHDLDAASHLMTQAYIGERTSGPRISEAGIPASTYS